ncbi:MAG: glycosyltransferase family 2 protein [Vicinamibacterales bacterium]
MPLVSVIMPAYNAAAYIQDALWSALGQTFRDLEVVVVDDGSHDGTIAIVRDLAAGDSRVRLIEQHNGGVATARNAALRVARGEFLALLDSDDVWAPTFLEAQLQVFRDAKVDIVTGNAFEIDGPRDGHPSRPYPDPRPDPVLATILADTEAIFIMSVFRREVIERIGLFDESMRSNEDYDFWLRAAAAGATFTRNAQPLGAYRRRRDSLSASEVRMLSGILTVYRKLRPSILDRPSELALLDRQIDRFETELLRAEARAAIEMGDRRAAAARLAELRQRRPSVSLAAAELLARWAPGLLPKLYRLRRARRVRQHASGAVA